MVEVAHEALLRNWPRLVDWIDKTTADDLKLLRQLEQATAEWVQHNRSGTFLWPRGRWRQAQAMRKRLKPTLGESEQKFLRCSRRRSALRSASLAAGLAAVTLVGAFFLWSNSRNLMSGEALDVLALELGLHSVVEPEMIEVPAGTFLMGAKEDEPNAESCRMRPGETIACRRRRNGNTRPVRVAQRHIVLGMILHNWVSMPGI